MPERSELRKPARTVLEQMIRERRLTFEEFAEYAETFARDHGEPGTLSLRHLQRLVAGRQPDGAPLGLLRPATARLLERIFTLGIKELLAPPGLASDITEATIATKGTVHPLTVAIAIVVNGADVLMVCRRGEDGSAILWQFPAGVVKPGMSSEIVAVRETLGETGVHCATRGRLGSRLHPITRVMCDYILCDYLTGNAENVDPVENVGVSWVDKTNLTRFIPAEWIYPPVLKALEVPA